MGSQQKKVSQLLNSQGSNYSFRHRSRRGAALLMTVLITLAAAIITIIIVQQNLDSSRNESIKNSTRSALLEAENLRETFELELQTNPTGYLSEVSAWEAPRVCVTESSTLTVNPGEKWPSDCANNWTYAETDSDTALHITPPSTTNAKLNVKYFGKKGAAIAGVQSNYNPSNVLTDVSSVDELNLNSFKAGEGSLNLNGLIYSVSQMILPDGNVNGSGVFSSETSLEGQRNDINTYIDAQNIRETVKTPVTLNEYKAQASLLKNIACFENSVNSCLQKNTTVTNTENVNTIIPQDVKAWMIIPEDETLKLYYSSKEAVFPVDCGTDCTVVPASGESINNGTHPGSMSYWTELPGVYTYPKNGVIYTDETLHVGFCGDAFFSSNAAELCQTANLNANLTFIAGSSETPKDIYLSGSITESESVNSGVFATGNVIFPYWAHKPNQETVYSLNMTTLNTITSLPTNVNNVNPDVFTGALKVKGSLTGKNISLPLSNYTNVTFNEDYSTSPSPYLGTGALQWSRATNDRLTAVSLGEMF